MIIKSDDLKNVDLRNKMIVFSTDTVYGLGALFNDEDAINQIYTWKGRSYTKPLPILFIDDKMFDYLNISKSTYDKMNKFWPGPVTFIVKCKHHIFKKDTVAIRKPKSLVAKKILQTFGPLAVTSLNKSGMLPLTKFSDIKKLNIDYIVNDSTELSGRASTIVNLVTNKLVREGAVSYKSLKKSFHDLN